MIHSSVYLFCVALTALLLSGCNVTFQSSQFNFVKGLFAQEACKRLKKTGRCVGKGRLYPVFAVNHDGGTFFADDGGFHGFF